MEVINEVPIGSQILEAGMHNANSLYQLVQLCASFDDTLEWALDGMPTAAHWIAAALDVEVCTAREWVRIGKKLTCLPLIEAAFEKRLLSYSKVRAITRFATTDNEAELLFLAPSVPAGRINKALAAWSVQHQSNDEIDNRQQCERGLFASVDPDGSYLLTLRLPPLPGAKALASVDARVMADHDASADASLAQRRADALVQLLTSGGTTVETEVIVHVRGDGISLDDGTPLSDSVLRELIPTSFIRTLIHEAQRLPINASGRHRHPSDRQKRVVNERDRCCVDCGSDEFLQYDHTPDFGLSRQTLVDELTLRCSRCHRKRHST